MIEIDDDALRFVVYAQSSLNAYRLKPVVEALEAQAPGLGWFVQSVLTAASSHALQIYDMGMAASMLEVFHADLDEFTDEGYARAILLANGESPPPAGKPIHQQTVDELREQYGFWPSDLLADVGGHAHLLQHWQPQLTNRPKVMSARAAARWLRDRPGHLQAETVEAALGLQRALARDRERAFVWDGDRDETEPLGAMCFLAWDAPQLLFEAVQHHEENQYNGGQAVEAFARRTLALAEADDAQLRALARRIANYLHCWSLLARLLAHFPVWEEGGDAA